MDEYSGYNSLAMTVLTASEVDNRQLDWTILRDGGVALYWQPEILAQDLNWLESKGYRIVSFEAGKWSSEDQMHHELKSDLSFPDYYGENLDAMNECICDDLVVPDEGGLVLVLRRYDRFAKNKVRPNRPRSVAEIVLEILARAVRYHMLFGRRLLILVQSDDPRIRFENLAPVFASWNPREWLDKKRGL